MDATRTTLAANLEALGARVEAARARSEHAADAVRILPVTKAAPASVLPHLLALGYGEIAENRVDQAAQRRADAPPGLVWHGIGHLQRNKAPRAVRVFDVFHALDSLRLADRLADLLRRDGRRLDVFVQVNAAEDPAKGGFAVDEVPTVLETLALSPAIRVRGFMTMARMGGSTGDLRHTFRTLRDLRDEAVRLGIGAIPPAELSMGMSADFEIAVEEGATLLRIGSAVFEGVPMPGDTDSSDPQEPS